MRATSRNSHRNRHTGLQIVEFSNTNYKISIFTMIKKIKPSLKIWQETEFYKKWHSRFEKGPN